MTPKLKKIALKAKNPLNIQKIAKLNFMFEVSGAQNKCIAYSAMFICIQ